ncbi:MAG: ASCH domain-containing protein [Nitrososphaeraceae archaeon]
MKCLSLKQPFAYLLANGEKTIEFRKWNTSFRVNF